jgi:hypothetical protein
VDIVDSADGTPIAFGRSGTGERHHAPRVENPGRFKLRTMGGQREWSS